MSLPLSLSISPTILLHTPIASSFNSQIQESLPKSPPTGSYCLILWTVVDWGRCREKRQTRRGRSLSVTVLTCDSLLKDLAQNGAEQSTKSL